MNRPAPHTRLRRGYIPPVAAPAEGPGLHRRWWPGLLRNGAIVFLAVCVALAAGGYLYLRYQLGRINRLALPGLSDDASSPVMNVLLVGSDSRENVQGDLAAATGKGQSGTGGQRSDTIMILHVDPARQSAAIMSIPRDLYVPIPGNGKDKINAAFAIGGAPLLIETIQSALGIEINHYAEVDFSGFERIVDTVGGVNVYVDAPARDPMTGLDIPVAGCSKLDGYQALAFVRSRYYETYERGRWLPGSNSDIERISRQQEFIRRMMKKAVSSGLTNPITLNRLVGIGIDNVKIDQAMSTKDITTLARRFRSLDADSVEMLTLPTSDGYSGNAAIQLLDTEKAYEYIDRLNGKIAAPSDVQPADVAVTVLNGNGIEGSAGRAATALAELGFRIAGTTSADNFGYTRTLIRYAPGAQARAELLKSKLARGAALERDASLAAGAVTLVVAADYDGVKAPAPAGSVAGGSSATAAPTTVTTLPPKPAC